MKLLYVFSLYAGLLSSVWAQSDIYKVPTKDPKSQLYASVIPIFDSDPQNENPYRIAIRNRSSGRIWGSDISSIDMVTSGAIQETTAFWSPNGKFVIFQMTPDRRSRIIRTYYIDRENGRLLEIKMPDYVQNMLGRLDRVSAQGYLSEKPKFISDDVVTLQVDLTAPGVPYLSGKASVKLYGDTHSEPHGELLKVSVDKGEQDAAANP